MDRKSFKSEPYHFVRNSQNGEIQYVVFPSDVKVGTSVFPSDLTINGAIYGSLQQTKDGLSYLAAGSNVTIASMSNGQIVISAAGSSDLPMGGDCSGTTANCTVIKINGASVPTSGTLVQGDILYCSATSTWSRLAAGTNGQFLKTSGAGANPSWASALTPDTGRIFLTNMASILAPTNVLGNFTTGQLFSVIGGGTIKCTGLKFYWVTTGGTFTIKCSLWSNAGVQLATVNVSASATGVYTATFGTPQTLNSGEIYTIGVYNATNYTRTTQATVSSRYPARPASVGGLVVVTDIRAFIGGDAKPTNADATEAYIVDPTLTFA